MATATEPTSTGRAGPQEWVGLAVLALPTILLGLDNNVLFLALPHLSADLGPSSTQVLWITDIYGFMIAGFLVTMGTLGDRIGRRRLLLVGASAFGLASIVTAYATSPEMLIAARALLGIAGATLMPSTLALISTMFADGRQRATAIAVWMSAFLAGGAGGPIIGGVLLEHFWWGSVFLLGVPVMALLLVTAPVLLPESRSPESRSPESGRLDLTSAGLSLAAILPVVYGLKELAAEGLRPAPVLAVAVGVLLGALFVRRQGALVAAGRAPLVDLRLFGNRAFSTALGLLLMITVVMGGTILFTTQYLQLVEGLSPLRAGLWLLPSVATLLIGNLLAPQLMRQVRPSVLIAAALTIAAFGFVVMTQVPSGDGLAWLITGYAVASLGLGPLATLGTDIVVGSAPPEQAGSASSMSETSSELGIALGVAVLGSVGTAVYRAQARGADFRDLPPDAADAARDTLASAVTEVTRLPSAQATEVLAAVRDAFTAGLHLVAGISAASALVFALVAVVVLRGTPAGTTSPAASPAAETERMPEDA